MITGYFYADTKSRHKEQAQIKKILVLAVEANLLYFIWNIALSALKGKSIITYIQSVFTIKNLFKFLILNESPLAGHLWYLGAILYVLVIVLLLDKFNLRKGLYILVPVLLVADLVFGKYSLLIFRHEFPYVLVRNFLCVGLPYFCIGNVIREKQWSPDQNVLLALITTFTFTGMVERFLLVNIGMNATRDHYISTTLLAVCLFLYVLKSNWNNKKLADIGRTYSTWLYIIHPIFITVFLIITKRAGLYSLYRFVAPIVVYLVTLTFLVILERVKTIVKK